MVLARPSKDPNDHVDGDCALGSFYSAWVAPMEERHPTFTTAFMQDETFPGIVRLVMVLCPFMQTMLSDRWHILDQRVDAAHNDRKFKLSRRMTLLLARYREIDPFACDLLVEILRINDRKAGRHSLVDNSYEPLDSTAQLFEDKVYGFADKVLRSLPQNEDLAGYELPKRFTWPVQPRRGQPGLVILPLPDEAQSLGVFYVNAIRTIALAMYAEGHGIGDVAAAARACKKNINEIHRHVRYAGKDGQPLSPSASHDAFTRLSHASHMRSPHGVLGLPQGRDRVQVAIVTREVLESLRGFHYSVLMNAGVGLIDRGRTMDEGHSASAPLRRLAMYGVHTMVGLASDPVWLSSIDVMGGYFLCGQTMVIVDDDPEAVEAIFQALSPVLAKEPDFKPILDIRWPVGEPKAH